MCTWAYTWLVKQSDHYVPLLFLAAIGGDVAIFTSLASAFGRACN
jgi:hypothetical protein